jgi:hypothetical protein
VHATCRASDGGGRRSCTVWMTFSGATVMAPRRGTLADPFKTARRAGP